MEHRCKSDDFFTVPSPNKSKSVSSPVDGPFCPTLSQHNALEGFETVLKVIAL